jgi:predicted HicB family RNase H-like nuclease
MTARRNPQITITLPTELHQQLVEAVKDAEIPLVHWCRQAIRAKLKQQLKEAGDD